MSWVVYSETVRRHLTGIAFWAIVAFLAIIALGTARFDSPASAWPMLIAVLAIVLGCAPIGPEFSSGTLQLILVKPVNRSAYLLSQVAGVVTVVWLAAIVAVSAEALGRAVILDEVRARVLGAALLNSAIQAVLIVAMLVFIGSFTRAYFNVGIYIALQMGIGLTVGLMALSKKFTELQEILNSVLYNLYPEAPPVLDPRWTLMVLSNAAVALLLACLIFRNREVPYGGD